MNQLTLRGFDEPLERRLRELAREREISLNRAALILLRRGAGLEVSATATGKVGDSLDSFVGVWSEAEEREFLESLSALEQIDPELWS
ncbi:MAG: hypothetical protein ACE5GX_20415 [Thermoanaerobaculia bacterium]